MSPRPCIYGREYFYREINLLQADNSEIGAALARNKDGKKKIGLASDTALPVLAPIMRCRLGNCAPPG
jgi:hypothetical protein